MIEDDEPAAVPSGPQPSAREGQDLGSTPVPAAQNGVVADVQAYIGRQLRAVYDDVAKQPVPERFLDLMRQLEERTGNG